MYARIVVAIRSVVDVSLLTAVELGLGEEEAGPRSGGALLNFGWGACPDGVVC